MKRLAALAIPLVSAACAISPAPTAQYFAPTAAQLGPELNSYGEAVLPRGALIVVQGDDLAYGLASGRKGHRINGASQAQAPTTISESLRHVLGPRVRIENRGFPGDTLVGSAKRWSGAKPGALLILAFGYGDMRAHTQTGPFADSLRAMIRQAHTAGSAVFVVIAPDATDRLFNANLYPYRAMAEAVARQEGAEVFPAATAMASAKETPASSAAQTARSYKVIAGSMAPYIKLINPAA